MCVSYSAPVQVRCWQQIQEFKAPKTATGALGIRTVPLLQGLLLLIDADVCLDACTQLLIGSLTWQCAAVCWYYLYFDIVL